MAKYTYEYEDGDYGFKENGIAMRSDKVIARLNECDLLAEQMNQLSDALVGYREGRHPELLERVAELTRKAENSELESQYREIADIIEQLNDLVGDIKAQA